MGHLSIVRVYATRGLYRPRSLGSLMDVNRYKLEKRLVGRLVLLCSQKKDWMNTHLCLSVSYHTSYVFKVLLMSLYFREMVIYIRK